MYINTCYGFLILIKYFLVYSTHAIKNSSFLKNIYKNKKPFSKCQRAGKSRLSGWLSESIAIAKGYIFILVTFTIIPESVGSIHRTNSVVVPSRLNSFS